MGFAPTVQAHVSWDTTLTYRTVHELIYCESGVTRACGDETVKWRLARNRVYSVPAHAGMNQAENGEFALKLDRSYPRMRG